MIVTRRKLARIERRLGKVYEIGGHRVRFKPSGMWATTHQRLIEAQGELIEAEWAASVAAMSAFEQRLGPLRAEARPA